MTQVLEAMFDGEVFRPVGAVKLAANTKVQLVIQTPSEQSGVSFLDVAEQLQLEGPSDWSLRLDDYLNAEFKHD
jgi:predicted DNA-binding antitoxin AbrB/MazE fold protein